MMRGPLNVRVGLHSEKVDVRKTVYMFDDEWIGHCVEYILI